MTVSVSNQIIQVIDALCEKFGVAIDWTSANVVPYLTTLMGKLIQWEIWSSVAYIVFAVIGFIVCVVVGKWCAKNFDDWDVIAMLGLAVCIVGGFFAISALVTQIMDIIKCCTFPEMFIFEYVQGLIKPAA